MAQLCCFSRVRHPILPKHHKIKTPLFRINRESSETKRRAAIGNQLDHTALGLLRYYLLR